MFSKLSGTKFMCSVFKINFYFFRVFSSKGENSNYGNPLKRKVRPNTTFNESRTANRICLTILGNGAYGHPCCVGLFTEFKSYFFNCGEGVGRLCREYDININFVRHIFITERKWKNISGLPDIYITNQTRGLTSLFLHGPPGIEHFSSIVSSLKLDLEIIRKCSNDSYIDHTLEVHYVPVKSTDIKKNSLFNESSDATYSYICQIFEKPGEFLVEKCVEYGVPVGSELLKLKNRECITLPSGQKISPTDVHMEPFPGIVFFVVDCPNESYLDTFVNEPKFEKFLLPENTAMEVAYVFHFTPEHIFSSSTYQKWVNRFHQNTQHFVLSNNNPSTSSAVIHKAQRIFQYLHPEIFCSPNEKEISHQNMFFNNSIIYPPSLLQLHLRPERKLSWSNVVDLKAPDEETDNLKNSSIFQDLLKNLNTSVKRYCSSVGSNKIYPEVIFLGTSSSTSSAYRNVSCILVNISLSNSILLDCGEGTVTQLLRYFGHDKIYSALRNISSIFISHKHTDHYLGLFELLRYRKDAFHKLGLSYEPVAVIMPYAVETIFKTFCEIFEPLNSAVRIFRCKRLSYEKRELLKKHIGDIEFFTVPVKHCTDSHAAIIQLKNQWKIVYSGDTAPCQKLIDAGKNCTILIHEASIEDGLVNEALAKMHSTPSQVVDIADKMNAQYTIMTHFSKRYMAVPLIIECNHRHIAYAFDFMKVQFSDWPLLPLFTPIIKFIFQEQLENHKQKTSSLVNFETALFKTVKS